MNANDRQHTIFKASAGLGFVAALAITGASHAGGAVTPQPVMGDPLDGLTASEMARWLTGRDSYDRNFTEGEGLGPLFNQTSCGACHGNPLGGPGSITVTRAGASTKGGFDGLEMFGGTLFHQESINEDCVEIIPPEANVIINRVTPGIMGYGIVEELLAADILANEDPLDADMDGISGVARMVGKLEDPMAGPVFVGRFGWKASDPTMVTFSAGAALNELGITNPLVPTENDPNGVNPPDLLTCDSVMDPEEDMDFVNELADFQRFLAPPPQTPKSGMAGEVIFNNIGCADCHIATWSTPDDPMLEDAIRNQTVNFYTDFLLHDMGLAADFIPDGTAGEREIKTPPLSGVRRRDPMWHDGRFAAGTFESRVTLAIEEHGAFLSEGMASATAFAALSPADKATLIAFLDSLGRREFDSDGDEELLIEDFIGLDSAGFRECFDAGGPFTADDPCAIHDIDQDGDVDLDDFDHFEAEYEGTLEDCNGNGDSDFRDILVGQLTTGGVTNGTIDGPASWDSNIPVDGFLFFTDRITAIGPDQGTGGITWASQVEVDLKGQLLEFDLLTYVSSDTEDFDRPVIEIDGTFYGLNADGTLGSVASIAQGDFGDIDNANQIMSPVHFTVDVEAIAGPGAHVIGFGTLSVDGQFGDGISRFDNVTPEKAFEVVTDDNNNGIPDQCCPGDVNGDTVVDIDDVVGVILAFGPCPVGEPCAADIDKNNVVDIDDVIAAVLGFGPCPMP